MMKTFEIKGFWGFVGFIVMTLIALTVLALIPTSLVWVTWNAFVSELLHGPELNFFQAVLLTLIVAITLKLIFNPQIAFEVKQIKQTNDRD